MQFQKVKLYLSSQRINRYLLAAGNSKTKAIKLYKASLKIAQAFHPILGVLEVVLRNRINTLLSAHFTDPDWIINQKTGFMNDASLTHVDRRTGRTVVNDFLRSSVQKAENRFRRRGIPITNGKIIAEQSFAFWTDLFEVHHYRLLSGKPVQVFKDLPAGHGRRAVCERLNKIRQLRNRINHNEPICFNGNNIDYTYAEEAYTALIEIMSWIDPELIRWIRDIDIVSTKIADAKNDWTSNL